MFYRKAMLVGADISALWQFREQFPEPGQVLVCERPEEALEVFQEFKPEVLVVGPGVSDSEGLIRKIRSRFEGVATSIFLTSKETGDSPKKQNPRGSSSLSTILDK